MHILKVFYYFCGTFIYVYSNYRKQDCRVDFYDSFMGRLDVSECLFWSFDYRKQFIFDNIVEYSFHLFILHNSKASIDLMDSLRSSIMPPSISLFLYKIVVVLKLNKKKIIILQLPTFSYQLSYSFIKHTQKSTCSLLIKSL